MRFILLVVCAISFLAYVHSDSCVQCTSKTDTKCATNPDSFLAKQCTNLTSKCYSRVLNGDTIRGCANELDNATIANCNNELECLICSFMEGCNRQIFPLHRAQCLQCVGNITGSCATEVFAKPTVCPTYKLGDKCFIRSNGRNNTESFQRGCLSTIQAKKLCIKEGNCFTCEGPGCNFLAADSDQIPLARDSATFIAYSLNLLLASFSAMRFL